MSGIFVIGLALFLIVISIPISFLIRCVGAVFSPVLRENIRHHKLRHAVWLVASICCAVILVVPGSGPYPTAKTQTVILISQIRVASMAYYNDYGAWPNRGTNADFARVLQGDNPRKIVYLQLNPKSLNAQGEIIDPWGTPFRIELNDPTNIVVWSAGPDKVWGTADDIRNTPALRYPIHVSL